MGRKLQNILSPESWDCFQKAIASRDAREICRLFDQQLKDLEREASAASHCVVCRRKMTPQIKQPVSARSYFAQDILERKASKEFVGPSDLCLPHLQPEGYIRSFVFHRFLSLNYDTFAVSKLKSSEVRGPP